MVKRRQIHFLRPRKGAKAMVRLGKGMSLKGNPFLMSIGEGFVDVFKPITRKRTQKRLFKIK